MSVAPEPFRTACLEVLHHAAIKARVIAWDEDFQKEQLRDLMDAVHNIPRWLNDWEHWDDDELRQSLAYYDQRWASKGWPNLTKIFRAKMAEARKVEFKQLPENLVRNLADATVELFGWEHASGTLSLRVTKEMGTETGTLRFLAVSHINLPARMSVSGIEQVSADRLQADWPGCPEYGPDELAFLLHGSWGERYFVVAESVDHAPD